MRKWLFVAPWLLLIPNLVMATTIHDLLDAVARQPAVEISSLAVDERALQIEVTQSALFPKIGAFGRAEYFNSPTNLRPMPPTEVNVLQGDSVPFSREILRYGLTLDAPVYVRELAVLRKQALILKEKSEIDRQIDRIGREAAVVSLNSSFDYLKQVSGAIHARKLSLEKAREDMTIRVQTGRTAESELLKILTSINDLDQQANDLTGKQLDAQRDLTSLTGMNISEPVPMTLVTRPDSGPIPALASQSRQVDAAARDIERQQAVKTPTLSITGMVSGNDGQAYNTDSHIYREYSGAALVLKFPLFDKSLSTNEALARVQFQKAKTRLAQLEIELTALAKNLEQKLPVAERSIELAQSSVDNARSLLEVAQVAVGSGRMTLEDYLRYESNVLAAQASLYQAMQQRWQILAQQASLYGTDLKGIVK